MFDIKAEDITIPEKCPVLGIDLIIGSGGMTPNAPTLDKVIPAYGYVKGNTRVISWMANRIKSNHTDPTIFEKIAIYIRSNKPTALNRALWNLAERMAEIKAAH